MEEMPWLYLTCDLPAPPLYPDELRENIIPQVPFATILSKFNGINEKEYKTHKDSTMKRFELTKLPPYIIVYIKVNSEKYLYDTILVHQNRMSFCHNVLPILVHQYIYCHILDIF